MFPNSLIIISLDYCGILLSIDKRQQIPAQFNKILIVGLGQLGLPVAKYVKERGFDAYGYDISPKAMDRAEKTAAIKKLLILVNLMYIFCVYQLINLKICSHLK